MALTAGTRLGPYEIVAPLGAGGMGEVYRAHDSRLERDVAIKVLPGHLSGGPSLRARFEREAKAVSGLNHPHICVLHDLGHSAGADQFLRMVHDEPGLGVPVDALVALGPNVSLETCFASRLYAKLDARDPGGTLAVAKALAKDIESLDAWLVVQNYLTQTFLKLGTDFEPLRRYAADLVAPFERPGDPLADWYRSARERIPFVRLVFAQEETQEAEALLARHLEGNVLGDGFSEDSFVIEHVHHLGLLDADIIDRHVAAAFASAGK